MKDFLAAVTRDVTNTPIPASILEGSNLPTRGLPYTDDFETIKGNFVSNNIRPTLLDGSMEGWLLRLSYWGTIKIVHQHPTEGKRTLTNNQFLEVFGNEVFKRMYGDWQTECIDFAKITFFRKFHNFKGKENTEKLIVTVNLRPDLKKTVSWWKILNPFN